MTKRLFVNGLPYHVTGGILENFFLAYGAVESVTVMIGTIADRSPDRFPSFLLPPNLMIW